MSYSLTLPDQHRCRDEILQLWSRNLPDATGDRYRWLYESGVSRPWLLETEDGECVGSAGRMTRNFCVAGQPITTGQAIDLNVDRAHRTIGPALALQKGVIANLEADSLRFIFGMPSPDAVPALKRVGYKIVGELQRWTLPIRLVRQLLKLTESPTLTRLITPPAELAWSVRLLRRPFVSGKFELYTGPFDERFDDLWNRCRELVPILGDRSAAYLNWRFANCPDLPYQTLILNRPNGRGLEAYCQFYLDEGSLCISDILAPTEKQQQRMLECVLRYARRNHIHDIQIVYFGVPSFGDMLKRIGFLRRPYSRPFMVYTTPKSLPPAGVDLYSPASWFITKADSDTDI